MKMTLLYYWLEKDDRSIEITFYCGVEYISGPTYGLQLGADEVCATFNTIADLIEELKKTETERTVMAISDQLMMLPQQLDRIVKQMTSAANAIADLEVRTLFEV